MAISNLHQSIVAGAAGAGGATPFDTTLIGNSVWVDGSADFLSKTPSAGTTTRWIWSSWVQRCEFRNDAAPVAQTIFSAGNALSNLSWIRFDDQDRLDFAVHQSSVLARKTSTAKYRDIGWYHICVSFDSGSGISATDRIKLFVNGLEVTDLSASTNTPSGQTTAFNANVIHEIGRYSYTGTQYVHAYLTQFTMLENKSFQNGDLSITDLLDSFTFGTNGSQFVPKADADIAALATAAGSKSFCFDFANTSNLGNDISGNSPSGENDFGNTSMSAANQTTNTPSNVTATLNPLIPNASIAYSEGNTKLTHTAFTQVVPTTIFATSGKFYAEVLIGKTGTWAGYNGVVPADDQAAPNWEYPTGDGFIWVSDGTLNHVSSSPSISTTYGNGDRLMFGLDVDNGWLFVGKNGTWYDSSGNSFTDLTNSSNAVATTLLTVSTAGWTFAPGASHVSGTTTEQIFLEASSWTYTAPTNFVSLSSANLTAPTYQGIDYFNTTVYEGNGRSQRVGDFVPFTDAYNVSNSLMFDNNDDVYLSMLPTSSDNNGKKFSISVWIKRGTLGSQQTIFSAGNNSTHKTELFFNSSDQLQFTHRASGTGGFTTTRVFRNTSSWDHILLAIDTDAGGANAQKLYINGVQETVGTFTNISSAQTSNMFENGQSIKIGSEVGSTYHFNGYMSQFVALSNAQSTPASFGQTDTSTNRWIPKDVSGLPFGTNGFYLEYKSTVSDGTLIAQGTGTPIGNMTSGGGLAAAFDGDIENYNSGAQANATSGNIGKDFGSGVTKTVTGVVVKMLGNASIDGGAAAETMTLTVERSDNGADFTTIFTESSVSVAAGAVITRKFGFSNTAAARYARVSISHSGGAETHVAELEFYENSSLLGSDLGTDTSGNSKHFTSNGSWATSNKFVDSPTKNYATLSQVTGLTPTGSNSGVADMSDGNLRFNTTASADEAISNGNSASQTPSEAFAIQEGKWYFEVEAITIGNGWNIIGLTDVDKYQLQTLSSGFLDDAEPGQWGYAIAMGSTTPDALIADGTLSYGSGSPYNGVSNHKVDTGDVLGVHIERTGNTYEMWFSRNGTHYLRNTTQSPIIVFSTTGRVIPFARTTNGSGNRELHFNFGQQLVFDGGATSFNAASDGYWKYAPASGFKAINQDNLDSTADKITAWAWIKNRDQDGDDHMFFDRVRGVGNDWHSNQTAVQGFNTNTVQRFLQRGVQIGNDVEVNTANESYVLWQWLLGDSATTGSTTSPAGTSASTSIVADHGGFSLGTYEGTGSSGATVGHGLSAAPEFIIIKDLDDAASDGATGALVWGFPTKSSTRAGDGFYFLNGQNAVFDNGGIPALSYFADTDPSATLITLNASTYNTDGQVYEFICFRNIPGVQKIGSYVGNGGYSQADGPYISLGFKPAWVMIKRSTGTANGDWNILDTARNPINIASPFVHRANLDVDDEAGTIGEFDFLSDGFKIRAFSANANTLNSEYIYIAMAEIGGNGTLPPIYGR